MQTRSRATSRPCFRACFVPRPRPGTGQHGGFAVLATIGLAGVLPWLAGCGALLLLGDAGSSAIAFATGELQSTEEVSLGRLDVAVGIAFESLGYDGIQATREEGRVHWTARTAGGDPVDIRLRARGRRRARIRIRVGAIGDETRSRLVLEQIRQSL